MHEGLRDIAWLDDAVNDGNTASFGHNASDCNFANCVNVNDGTDGTIPGANDCGEPEWRLQTKFDTSTGAGGGTWTNIPTALTTATGAAAIWPFTNPNYRKSPIRVDTMLERWEGLHVIRVTLHWKIFGPRDENAAYVSSLDAYHDFGIDIINPCRRAVLTINTSKISLAEKSMRYTMGVRSDDDATFF